MQVFVCYCSQDSKFVIQVASLIKTNCEKLFYYEEHPNVDKGFTKKIGDALSESDHLIVFIGSKFSDWQEREIQAADVKLKVCKVFLKNDYGASPEEPNVLNLKFPERKRIDIDPKGRNAIFQTSWEIMKAFGSSLYSFDGLPFDPNLFSYEKDIIAFFSKMINFGEKAIFSIGSPSNEKKSIQSSIREGEIIRQKVLNGCPIQWPPVVFNSQNAHENEPITSKVVAAALNAYHDPAHSVCMIQNKLYFPEARSQQNFQYPSGQNDTLNVAIIVAGGIAPGINAVIDGIVQRHWQDAIKNSYQVLIYGLKNGLSAINLDHKHGQISEEALLTLAPTKNILDTFAKNKFINIHQWEYSAEHAREGGSVIGTSRVDEIIHNRAILSKVVEAFLGKDVKILYVIGGDGSMKLAHAIWHYANWDSENYSFTNKLSVVAVPKTMDNDILWVWQSFGFLSAVEKAREILTILDTEIKSNPRLCILQLFGSDSGFVVSHTVAASGSDQCDAALIPEVRFCMLGLAQYLKRQMYNRKKVDQTAIVPSGFVVMSETAIPTDALIYVDIKKNIPTDLKKDWQYIQNKIGFNNEQLTEFSKKINLSADEKNAIYDFHRLRRCGQRIQGQTSDTLRSAGLKIVSRGLQELIKVCTVPDIPEAGQPDWHKLRIVTNEPRHVLRSIAPTCSDIIMGQRLGTLAVDNAMAGYTDFMISQWLTEFVLVPLQLVVLGRKRIPMDGMFWKSVLAKTSQPENLDIVGDLPN